MGNPVGRTVWNHSNRVGGNYQLLCVSALLSQEKIHKTELIMQLYKANILYTPTPQAFKVIEGGYVVVDDNGIILSVTKTKPARYADVPVTDFGDSLLIPAMNDMHVHAPQYRNMGMAMDEELLPWLNTYTFPEESRYRSRRYAEVMYRRFVHDLWLNGTMRSSVFATVHLRSTMLLADLFAEAGMGAKIGLVGMDRNCPDRLSNTPVEAVRNTERLSKHLSGMPLVEPIITPRFVPSCSSDMLRALGDLAQRTGLAVQSHLSENRSEIAWVQSLEPESTCYGDAYHRYGLFGQTPTLMAHCCYTAGEELELMQRRQVMAVHCPTSNCNLGSGIAPVRTFLQHHIPVALGSDVAAGHHLSMFRVMQYALEMSKLQYAATEGKLQFLSLSEVFYLATKSGGSFFGKVGSFERGYAFDALVIDDHALNATPAVVGAKPYDLQHRLERYIYLGDDRQLTHRFCQGRCLPNPISKSI